MKTNITPIEALEKIANQKDFCVLHETDWNRLECDGCSVDFCPRYIARKALASQETQQKTFTLEEIKEIFNKNAIELPNMTNAFGIREVLGKILSEFEKEAE